MPDTVQTNTYTEFHRLEMDQSSGGTWVNLPSASTIKYIKAENQNNPEAEKRHRSMDGGN
jgi:hypothetical protein